MPCERLGQRLQYCGEVLNDPRRWLAALKRYPAQLKRNITCDLFIQTEMLFLASNQLGGIHVQPARELLYPIDGEPTLAFLQALDLLA